MNRWAALAFVVIATMAARVDATPPCAAECVRRMAECRATRCADLSRRSCRDQCRAVTGCAAGAARIATLLSLVTECRSDPAGWTLRQRLEVRRGDCAPVVIKEVETPVPVPDRFGWCATLGDLREPIFTAFITGVFERLEVSSDGKSVVYELTDDHVFEGLAPPKFSLQEEGMFFVRADGTGGYPLGPASRNSRCTVTGDLSSGRLACDAGFESSPNGQLVVFSDRAPGPDGEEAAQLVTLDVRTGDRRQVTNFRAADQTALPPGFDSVPQGYFLDNDTIKGFTYDPKAGRDVVFTVETDGSGFRTFNPEDIGSDGKLVSVFGITGRPRAALVLWAQYPSGAREIVVKDRGNMLELTNFGRADTRPIALAPAGKRIFFQASADPVGKNPQNLCQIFSIDNLGGDLRQITRLVASEPSPAGCSGLPPPASCWVQNAFLDAKLDTLTFTSSCDPFGTNPHGVQTFAVRTDGSGLRQVTNYRGLQKADDGTVTVELGGGTTGP